MEEINSERLRIGVVGPESSGKSQLTRELATHFNGYYNEEFARSYLTTTQGKYNQHTLDYILQQQLMSEQQSHQKLLFCDTTPIDIKIWSDYKYGNSSLFIKNAVKQMQYNFILLLKPDLPYENDPLRENELLKDRLQLFDLFIDELNRSPLPFAIIEGYGEIRTKNAIKVLQKKFSI